MKILDTIGQKKRGLLTDDGWGEASSLPPTLSMRFGQGVTPWFDAVKRLFPGSNPYGKAITKFLLGNAPQSAQRMAEGYPNELGNFRGDQPLNYTLNQNAVDMAGALPIGATADAAMKLGMLGKAGLGAKEAMLAFHGSPHRFDAFDMSKIGTGEGAQAYGHGLYFAENPAVADEYSHLGKYRPSQEDLAKYYAPGNTVNNDKILDYNPTTGLVTAERTAGGKKFVTQYMSTGANSLDVAKAAGKDSNLYHVDIPDEHIDKMLHWDKPLNEQSPQVQKMLGDSGMSDLVHGNQPARELHHVLRKAYGEAGASAALQSIGIPGIKYLDQGSRGAGNGTHNFVLFDDSIPKILKRE